MAAIELASTSLFSDANLIAYYKCENANDSKNTNHMNNNNSVTFPAGKFNNCADLGSTDTNKSLTIASALSYANAAYSISMWVNINTAPSSGQLYQLSNVYTTTSQILFNYENSGGTKRINFTRFDGANLEGPSYNVDLGTGTWHHIVWTHDGTSIRGYLNGFLVAGPTTATGQTGSYSVASTIGCNGNDNTANTALAKFDDVAFFNRELTAAEVLLLSGAEIDSGYFFMSY